MNRIIILSHIIDERTPTYGQKSKIILTPLRQMLRGDVCNEMLWEFGNHVGTHVDAPRHFMAKGKTIDEAVSSSWIFEKVALVKLRGIVAGQMIMSDDLGDIRKDAELLLIKTGFERKRGQEAYWKAGPGLHPDMVSWLKRKCSRLRAVGMDIISISSLQHRDLGRAAHQEFLKRGIFLVEDMKLSFLKQAPAKVVVAPLRVRGADASPCTVFAWSRA